MRRILALGRRILQLAVLPIPKALEAVDKYAALLPTNDPNPIDTRGDVLAISGRLEDAIAQYRKDLKLNPHIRGYPIIGYPDVKIALCYLYEGKYTLAETGAQQRLERGNQDERALAVGVLGDIEIARGRLEEAAARYEEAAHLSEKLDVRRSAALEWKAVQIYLEQRQPEQALALARRLHSPWAPGFRGIAHLLMSNLAAAEKGSDPCISSIPTAIMITSSRPETIASERSSSRLGIPPPGCRTDS